MPANTKTKAGIHTQKRAVGGVVNRGGTRNCKTTELGIAALVTRMRDGSRISMRMHAREYT